MRIGVISAYPEEDWHSQRILEAACSRGTADVLSPLDFTADVRAGRTQLLVRGAPHQIYDLFLTPRALGDHGDHELQLELYRTLAEDGALMVNEVSALTTAIDKFRTSWLLGQAGLPTPRAIVAQRLPDAIRALETLGGRAVAKPLYGSLGIGVELVDSEDAIAKAIERWNALYLQEYVDGGNQDIRAFVVGGRVEAAIRRKAPAGEFRTNIHLGGVADEVRLDEKTERLAVQAVRLLGLDYGGVDILPSAKGPMVIEVNGTPLFRGIWEATGRDMAAKIVEHALERAHLRHLRAGGTAEPMMHA